MLHLSLHLMNLFLLFSIVMASSSTTITSALSSSSSATPTSPLPPPIVYTIAGSDSGGGAGIQADLHTIHSFHCHGCSAITALTAQNSIGVQNVHIPPLDFLQSQLDALETDLKPVRGIKIGMVGSKELALVIGSFLQKMRGKEEEGQRPFVVVDPVMISTSGHSLINEKAKKALIEFVFPYADVLTPNKFEAEALLGRQLETPKDVEEGAKEILKMGVKSVLIKGGHSLLETSSSSTPTTTSPDVNATIGYAQDYFLSSTPPPPLSKRRLCDASIYDDDDDGNSGVWIRTNRYDSEHTHGTGCTLSSAIASALALGHQQRFIGGGEGEGTGATRAIWEIDACCLAKAYVTAGIGQGKQLGQGPGPVVHTQFPSTHQHFPTVVQNPSLRTNDVPAFLPMKSAIRHRHHSSKKTTTTSQSPAVTLGKILPIVSTLEWIQKLSSIPTITDIQLRIKDKSLSQPQIQQLITDAQTICSTSNKRLWINDYWKEATQAKCFGVHLGQEDLTACVLNGGISKLKEAGLALGISTHSYGELAVALGVQPSYISLGPVYGTTSKDVNFDPQGVETIRKWRELIEKDVPLVVIGGINDEERVRECREAGADCVAVIGAVTKAEDVDAAVEGLDCAMEEE